MPREMYRPVKVVNTADLNRNEWLLYRKHGIGGSDLPVLLEASNYKSILGLWSEKTERIPIADIEAITQARLAAPEPLKPYQLVDFGELGIPIIDPGTKFSLAIEVGKALEPAIGKYLSCRLGMPVFKDTWMYAHPTYPWMIVDLDFVMLAPDENGELAKLVIIECKTAAFWKKDEWEYGVPWDYEMQVRHAMCVMNVDEAIIICLYDNNEGGVSMHKIERDYGLETFIVMKEKSFWKDVENQVLPIPTIPTKAAKYELARYASLQPKYDQPLQLADRELAKHLDIYEEQLEETKQKEKAYEESKQHLDAVTMKLSSFLFHHDEAVCNGYRMKWTQKASRSVDYDALKLAHPDIYAKFVSENTSRGFEVKPLKKTKKNLKEAA